MFIRVNNVIINLDKILSVEYIGDKNIYLFTEDKKIFKNISLKSSEEAKILFNEIFESLGKHEHKFVGDIKDY